MYICITYVCMYVWYCMYVCIRREVVLTGPCTITHTLQYTLKSIPVWVTWCHPVLGKVAQRIVTTYPCSVTTYPSPVLLLLTPVLLLLTPVLLLRTYPCSVTTYPCSVTTYPCSVTQPKGVEGTNSKHTACKDEEGRNTHNIHTYVRTYCTYIRT